MCLLTLPTCTLGALSTLALAFPLAGIASTLALPLSPVRLCSSFGPCATLRAALSLIALRTSARVIVRLSFTRALPALSTLAHGDAGLGIESAHLVWLQVWFIAQGCVRHFQNIASSGYWNGHIGCHSGKQLHLGIVEIHNRVIRHHVLYRGGIHADLFHASRKLIARESVHFECGAGADFHVADIAFIGLGINLHLGQILRDGEQGRRLQRRSHSLADIHVAAYHHSIDRRANDGVINDGLRHGNGCGFLLHLRIGLKRISLCDADGGHRRIIIRLRYVKLLLGHNTLLGQGLGTFIIGAGLGFSRFCLFQVRSGGGCVGAGCLKIGLGLQQSPFQ